MKKLLEVFFTIFFGIYVMGTTIATPYYVWQDIKEHNSFVRYIFVSPIIGFFNSLIWPYKVYQSNFTKNDHLTEIQKSNLELFMSSQNILTSSINLIQAIPTSKDIKGDIEKIESLMNGAKEKLQNTDKVVLNSIYNGLGDVAHDKLLKAIEYYQSGMKGNKTDLPRGDALLIDFNKWMEDNWTEIVKVIQKN